MGLEELDASLAQGNGDLHTVLFQDELIRRREKVRYNLNSAEPLICVFWCAFHRASCLDASSQRQISESSDHDR